MAVIIGTLGIIGVSTPGRADDLSRLSLPTPVVATPASTTPLVATPTLPETQTAPAEAADDDAFASLADAVAAQTMPETLDSELRCLAGTIYFEAKGEPLRGQLAVAEVVLNRARSGRFPASVCGVVTQAGQFSFVRGGAMPSVPNNAAYRTAVAIAQVAMSDAWQTPASNALFFHASRVSPGWGKTMVASIGHHVFYR